MGRGRRSSSNERWYQQNGTHREHDEDEYEDWDGKEEEVYEVRPRRRASTPPPVPRASRYVPREGEAMRAQPRQYRTPRPKQGLSASRPPRKRRVLPILLTGCALGVVLVVLGAAVIVILALRSLQGNASLGTIPGLPGLGTKTMNKTETVETPLTAISQIQICDRVGNVTMDVDPTATKTTVSTNKIVHVANQSDADQEFKRISVEIQPPTTLTKPLACAKSQATPGSASGRTASESNAATASIASALMVNVTFPDMSSVSDSVDITITTPPSVVQSSGGAMQIEIEAPLGNVVVNGFSGLLNIRGGTGVKVQRAILAAGSQLETSQGNVTFNGYLALPADPKQDAKYILQGENGIDVTLPSSYSSLNLDANTNAGTGSISNEFDSKGASNHQISYYGPADPTSSTKMAATLVLDVGSGNVNIHKAAQTQ